MRELSVPSLSPQADARLQHLFRRFLRQGRLHPLYPLLQRYRSTPASVSVPVRAGGASD